MFTIKYMGLVEGSTSLHILKPESGQGNDTQYLLMIETQSDLKVICIVGDWEFDAVLDCIWGIAEQLQMPDRKRARIGTGSEAASDITFSMSQTADGQRARFRLHVHDCESAIIGVGFSDTYAVNQLAFEIPYADLPALGRLFERSASADFEPAFLSMRNDWFLPNPARDSRQLAYMARDKMIAKVRKHFASIDCEMLHKGANAEMGRLQPPLIHECPNCFGLFAAMGPLQSHCRGCYRGRAPLAFSPEQVEAAAWFEPWLQPLPETQQEEDLAIR